MALDRIHPEYEKITERWGGMDIRMDLADRIDVWLNAFPEKDHPFLLELLGNFSYYTEERINENVVVLYNKMMEEYGGPLEEMIFAPVFKKRGVAYSAAFFQAFWMRNNLYDNAKDDILNLVTENGAPKQLAIIDDYSGSGKTFETTIEKLISVDGKIVNTNIYFITLHMTRRAFSKIEAIANKYNMSVTPIYLDFSDETFKEGYIYEAIEAKKKEDCYKELCSAQKLYENILGFEDVASLVSFYYNSPNDTLVLFWEDLVNFSALFPRHNKKKRNTALNRMREDAEKRKNNDEPIMLYGVKDGKMAVMLAFCLGQGENFSAERFKDTFGLTDEQADEALRRMIDEGYMRNEKGSLMPTERLRVNTFSSRVSKGQSRFDRKPKEKRSFKYNTSYIPGDY